MRCSSILLSCTAAVLSGSASAQLGPGTVVDGTNDVRSQSLGVPGPATSPTDQLRQRQALQDDSGDKKADHAKLGPARPARKDELSAGAIVNDKTGAAIAKIEAVDADGIVVSTGAVKIKVPAEAFGHNKAGLLLDMTKSDFDKI